MKDRSRRKKMIVLSFSAGVLLFLFGWFFVAGVGPSQPVEDSEVGGPHVVTEEDRKTGAPAQKHPLYGIEPPQPNVGDLPPQISDAVDDISRRVDAGDIPADVIAEVRRNSLNRDGTISDALKELLMLSPEEVSFINEHIQNTAEVINEREIAKVEVVRSTEREVKLHVPALTESERLETEFREGIINFLGEENGHLFLDLIDSSHLGYLDGFGRFDRTMKFSVAPRDDGGFMVEFRQASPPEQVERYYAERGTGISGEVGMGRSFGSLYPLRRELPNIPRFGRSIYMLDLLPEDIRYFFERIEDGKPSK